MKPRLRILKSKKTGAYYWECLMGDGRWIMLGLVSKKWGTNQSTDHIDWKDLAWRACMHFNNGFNSATDGH